MDYKLNKLVIIKLVIIIAFFLSLVLMLVGLYVGIWLMFFGGFADAINLFKTSVPVGIIDVAIALLKIIFGIPIFWFSIIFSSVGFGIFQNKLSCFYFNKKTSPD